MKRALVISGGGAKGAYGVGFVKHLKENAPGLMNFDAYVGTSSGALLAPFIALDRIPTLLDIFSNTEDKDVIKQKKGGNPLKKISIFSTKPLERLIENNLTDSECNRLIGDPALNVHLLTGCLQSRRLTVFTTADDLRSAHYDVIRIRTPQVLKDAMLASANQPVFMPPIQVNREETDPAIRTLQYVDGGVVEYVGTEIAMNAGADEILTIILASAPGTPDPTPMRALMNIVGATLDTFIEDVGRNDVRIARIINDGLSYTEQIREGLRAEGVSDAIIAKVFNNAHTDYLQRGKPHKWALVRPSQPIKGGLRFIPKEMRKMIELGEQDARDFLAGGGIQGVVA